MCTKHESDVIMKGYAENTCLEFTERLDELISKGILHKSDKEYTHIYSAIQQLLPILIRQLTTPNEVLQASDDLELEIESFLQEYEDKLEKQGTATS